MGKESWYSDEFAYNLPILAFALRSKNLIKWDVVNKEKM